MKHDLNETMRLQRAHRSIRRYRPDPIPRETLETLIRCGQAASTSSFIQAYSIVRVTDPEHRKAIAEAAGGQPWIIEAPEFLIFCADLRRIDQACRKAGEEPLEGMSEHALVAIIDVSLMAQNLFLAAESLGLGGVYIGGIRNDDPRVVVDCLRLPRQVLPVFGMCLGRPREEPKQPIRPRMPVDLILHNGQYHDATDTGLAAYDETTADYYRARPQNPKTTVWSTEIAQAVQGKKREHMSAFLHERGFFRK